MQRITAVLLGRVGDLVVSTAFLSALRRARPKARIELVVRSYCLDAASLIPSVDAVSTPAGFRWLAPADLFVDLNPSRSRSASLLRALAPAKLKVKADEAGGEREHMLDRYARLAAGLGLPYEGRMELRAPSPRRGAFGTKRGLRLLIHPGNFKKLDNRWPEENFRALNAELLKGGGVELFYLAGPGEEAPVKAIAGGLPVLGPASLAVTAGWMAEMDAFVCNITGTTHLAAALGVPTFGLYSGYTDAVWRPRDPIHGGVVAASWQSCRGITVEQAAAGLKAFLGRLKNAGLGL